MKLMLKDLKPGDEFEYANTTQMFRRGKFLVLGEKRKNSVFIFSFTANKTCRHWDLLNVNLISKAKENNMENSKNMGHFTGWQFGVPVKIFRHRCLVKGYDRLIHESEVSFVAVNNKGGSEYFSKSDGHTYELIPHKAGVMSPRYPVCVNSKSVVYCNAMYTMAIFDITSIKLERYPAATLVIGGKTIELSDETVAELKKKLGI